ncbi:MAG TPA: lamin tail domain-containing protein [Candidatus Eisenbacteria bacterium]|nr:lamin tail domain-containing protein [Candidatus Eisenbacteria bacterium]
MVRTWGVVIWVVVLAMAVALAIRFAPPARAQPATGLVLNEILAGPARDWDGDGLFDARKDEWVEIRNDGGATVDLAAYRLADADSTIRFAFTGLLAPGGVVLVTGTAALDWQRAAGRSATGLSLNNSGDTVHLFQIAGADTMAVDVKSYNSIEGATDRSTGRFGGAWVLFDALNKYTGSGEPKGSGCPPTPGAENGCTTKVSETTWGWIKANYR